MNEDDILAQMELWRDAVNHINIEQAREVWPYLSEAQIEHLDDCQACRKLVADSRLPVLYLGPVQNIAYELERADAVAEWLLDEWQEHATRSCLWTADVSFDNIDRKKVDHICRCAHCRRLVNFLSRNGGEFAQPYANPGDVLGLVEMNEEIHQACQAVCLKDTSRDSREACWHNCLRPVSLGRDRVILVPRPGKENEHVKKCLHCQTVMFNRWHRNTHLSNCFDAKTWRYFPVYMQEDQAGLEEHIHDCTWCQGQALSRLRINMLLDKAALKNFKLPKFGRVHSALRSVKRFWGDWVSSWRFHFGRDGMFSMRHPWAIWNEHDRLLKIARNKNLSEWEQLYRRAVAGEATEEQVLQEFGKIFAR